MPKEKIVQKKCDHDEILKRMATKEFTDDIVALLKIRAPIIYLICNEEKRMLTYFKHLSAARGFRTQIWDCHLGMRNLADGSKSKMATTDDTSPDTALDIIISDAETDVKNKKTLDSDKILGKIYLLLDFDNFLVDPSTERRLKRLSQIESMTTVVIVAPCLQTTPGLENLLAVLDFPFPNQEEIIGTLESLCNAVKSEIPGLEKDAKKKKEAIVNAVNGLTLSEAQNALAKSVVRHRKFHLPTILLEKKNFIRRKGVLEFFSPDRTMSDIGGLKNMIRWFERRKLALESGAKKYGLPPLKGVLLLGIPGTGKSLSAKAVAALYNIPLLRLDFGSLFSSGVGDSEHNARQAIKLAEAMEPDVLWIDEVEKGISGTASSGMTDGGTTDRVVSTFLTWMQEKTTQVFVIATANDHLKIPPAFMRAGRFDEVFFIGFPNRTERKQIFEVLIRRYKRDPNKFNTNIFAKMTPHFTGAEIEKVITTALFEGYAESREPTNDDIEIAIGKFSPQYEMRKEYFNAMITWGDGRGCIKASDPEELSAAEPGEDNKLGLIDMSVG